MAEHYKSSGGSTNNNQLTAPSAAAAAAGGQKNLTRGNSVATLNQIYQHHTSIPVRNRILNTAKSLYSSVEHNWAADMNLGLVVPDEAILINQQNCNSTGYIEQQAPPSSSQHLIQTDVQLSRKNSHFLTTITNLSHTQRQPSLVELGATSASVRVINVARRHKKQWQPTGDAGALEQLAPPTTSEQKQATPTRSSQSTTEGGVAWSRRRASNWSSSSSSDSTCSSNNQVEANAQHSPNRSSSNFAQNVTRCRSPFNTSPSHRAQSTSQSSGRMRAQSTSQKLSSEVANNTQQASSSPNLQQQQQLSQHQKSTPSSSGSSPARRRILPQISFQQQQQQQQQQPVVIQPPPATTSSEVGCSGQQQKRTRKLPQIPVRGVSQQLPDYQFNPNSNSLSRNLESITNNNNNNNNNPLMVRQNTIAHPHYQHQLASQKMQTQTNSASHSITNSSASSNGPLNMDLQARQQQQVGSQNSTNSDQLRTLSFPMQASTLTANNNILTDSLASSSPVNNNNSTMVINNISPKNRANSNLTIQQQQIVSNNNSKNQIKNALQHHSSSGSADTASPRSPLQASLNTPARHSTAQQQLVGANHPTIRSKLSTASSSSSSTSPAGCSSATYLANLTTNQATDVVSKYFTFDLTNHSGSSSSSAGAGNLAQQQSSFETPENNNSTYNAYCYSPKPNMVSQQQQVVSGQNRQRQNGTTTTTTTTNNEQFSNFTNGASSDASLGTTNKSPANNSLLSVSPLHCAGQVRNSSSNLPPPVGSPTAPRGRRLSSCGSGLRANFLMNKQQAINDQFTPPRSLESNNSRGSSEGPSSTSVSAVGLTSSTSITPNYADISHPPISPRPPSRPITPSALLGGCAQVDSNVAIGQQIGSGGGASGVGGATFNNNNNNANRATNTQAHRNSPKAASSTFLMASDEIRINQPIECPGTSELLPLQYDHLGRLLSIGQQHQQQQNCLIYQQQSALQAPLGHPHRRPSGALAGLPPRAASATESTSTQFQMGAQQFPLSQQQLFHAADSGSLIVVGNCGSNFTTNLNSALKPNQATARSMLTVKQNSLVASAANNHMNQQQQQSQSQRQSVQSPDSRLVSGQQSAGHVSIQHTRRLLPTLSATHNARSIDVYHQQQQQQPSSSPIEKAPANPSAPTTTTTTTDDNNNNNNSNINNGQSCPANQTKPNPKQHASCSLQGEKAGSGGNTQSSSLHLPNLQRDRQPSNVSTNSMPAASCFASVMNTMAIAAGSLANAAANPSVLVGASGQLNNNNNFTDPTRLSVVANSSLGQSSLGAGITPNASGLQATVEGDTSVGGGEKKQQKFGAWAERIAAAAAGKRHSGSSLGRRARSASQLDSPTVEGARARVGEGAESRSSNSSSLSSRTLTGASSSSSSAGSLSSNEPNEATNQEELAANSERRVIRVRRRRQRKESLSKRTKNASELESGRRRARNQRPATVMGVSEARSGRADESVKIMSSGTNNQLPSTTTTNQVIKDPVEQAPLEADKLTLSDRLKLAERSAQELFRKVDLSPKSGQMSKQNSQNSDHQQQQTMRKSAEGSFEQQEQNTYLLLVEGGTESGGPTSLQTDQQKLLLSSCVAFASNTSNFIQANNNNSNNNNNNNLTSSQLESGGGEEKQKVGDEEEQGDDLSLLLHLVDKQRRREKQEWHHKQQPSNTPNSQSTTLLECRRLAKAKSSLDAQQQNHQWATKWSTPTPEQEQQQQQQSNKIGSRTAKVVRRAITFRSLAKTFSWRTSSCDRASTLHSNTPRNYHYPCEQQQQQLEQLSSGEHKNNYDNQFPDKNLRQQQQQHLPNLLSVALEAQQKQRTSFAETMPRESSFDAAPTSSATQLQAQSRSSLVPPLDAPTSERRRSSKRAESADWLLSSAAGSKLAARLMRKTSNQTNTSSSSPANSRPTSASASASACPPNTRSPTLTNEQAADSLAQPNRAGSVKRLDRMKSVITNVSKRLDALRVMQRANNKHRSAEEQASATFDFDQQQKQKLTPPLHNYNTRSSSFQQH